MAPPCTTRMPRHTRTGSRCRSYGPLGFLLLGPRSSAVLAGACRHSTCLGGGQRWGGDRRQLRVATPEQSRLVTPETGGRGGGSPLLHGSMRAWRGGGTAGGTPPTASKGEPKKSKEPSAPPCSTGDGVKGGNTVRAGTMESASLLAGNVQRLQFLRKKTGVDLGVTVYSLYAMAIRSVISTVGQPLRDATARRTRLFGAASDEAAAAGAAAAAASGEAVAASMLDGTEGVVGAGGAAAEALAREALEPMPFAYLPSVGAMLLLVAAVAAHVLLLLGKKWSVRFHAWSAFDEVLTWEEADAVLVTPVRHTGSPAICPLVGTPRFLRDPTATEEGRELEDELQDAEEEEQAVSSRDESGGTPGATKQDGDGEGTEGLGEDLSSEEVSTSTEYLSEEKEEEARISGGSRKRKGAAAASGTTASATTPATGADVGADPPSFVYQRRKFVLKRAVTDAAPGSESKRENEEKEE
ncbi:unnamed protein product, partial [Ectocarpus sp. 12 AP-2014]